MSTITFDCTKYVRLISGVDIGYHSNKKVYKTWDPKLTCTKHIKFGLKIEFKRQNKYIYCCKKIK